MAKKPKSSKFDLLKIRNAETIALIKHIRNTTFSAGDILIKHSREPNDDGKPTIYHEKYDNSTTSVRYKVVHVDDDNIPYIQQISLEGKLDGEPFIAFELGDVYDGDEFECGSITTYEVDPLFVEATIMGQEFDIVGFLKEVNARLKLIEKTNKKNAILGNNLLSVNEFFSKIKKGDTFFFQDRGGGGNGLTSSADQRQIKSIRKLQIDKLKPGSDARYSLSHHLGKELENDDVLYEIKTICGQTAYSCQFNWQYLYYSKPLSGEET